MNGPDEASLATQPEEGDDTKPLHFVSRNDDDDDDGEESLSSSSDEEAQEASLSLLERRAINDKRNDALLSRLGLDYGFVKRKSKKNKRGAAQLDQGAPVGEEGEPMDRHTPTAAVKRGMLLARRADDSSRSSCISSTARTFPYREAQIRKLSALLMSTENFSAPIMISGPSGSGKTAVVRSCVEQARRRTTITTTKRATNMIHAHVDCAALDAPSMDEVTRSAYHQIELQITGTLAHKKRRKRTSAGNKTNTQADDDDDDNDDDGDDNDDENNNSHFVSSKPGARQPKTSFRDKVATEGTDGEDDPEERIERNRSRRRKRKRSAKKSASVNVPKSSSEVSLSLITCVWNFGCMLDALMTEQHSCILVLDHAERVLSFQSNQKDGVNFLSQILLLPRVLGLNLTIVVISQSVLLGQTRKSQYTSRQSLVNWLHVHFLGGRVPANLLAVFVTDRFASFALSRVSSGLHSTDSHTFSSLREQGFNQEGTKRFDVDGRLQLSHLSTG